MTADEEGAGAGLRGERREEEAQTVCCGPVERAGHGYPTRL